MRFKKGSKEAKAFMAKIRAKKGKKKVTKKAVKKIGAIKKPVQKKATKKATPKNLHKDVKSHNVNIRVMSGLFDTSVIKDIDALKKQYFNLAKKYHPDAGGTTSQFQELQKEYEKLFKALLNGSTLNSEQKTNEVEIDKAIRDIIDSIITLEGISIEVVGKWLWVGGNTYPVYQILKSSGLQFIKKAGVPYWVYKGVESSGRGKMTMEEIKTKYGVTKFDKPIKKIGSVHKLNRSKIKKALLKLKKGLDKRPI